MFNNYGPLFLLVVLLIVITYAFFGPIASQQPPSLSKISMPEPTCKDDERIACNNSFGCSGERVCVDGAWTGCITKRICTPGTRTQCIENFCSTGYKICNECGSGYGECVYQKPKNENCSTKIGENIYREGNEVRKVIWNYTVCDGVIVSNNTYEIIEKINENKQSINLSENINFKEWASTRNIELVGVNKSVNDFYYNGSKQGDFLNIDNIPNVLEVSKGLYKISDDLLRVMKGKTLYLSYQNGRGYTVLGSWPEQGILAGMNRGSILEQPLTEQQAVHEFAHILDYHGIRGIYDDKENHWKHLDEKRARIFNVTFKYNPSASAAPAGYMDVYSTANDAENFAQHFAFYILQGEEFRNRAKSDSLLKEKYEFFKDLFNGSEY